MANLSGTLNVFRALAFPRLIVPSIQVKTIQGIDFRALKEAGYRGAIFDKDNCLTKPYHDRIEPSIQEAWAECKEVFGEGNVLIVSNSAGTSSDPGGIQAESVSHHLGVPVLFHSTKKPGCIAPIQRYFATLPHPIKLDPKQPKDNPSPDKIIVVGDRLFTDVLLSNRLGPQALSIWTTGLWVKESMFLRWMESRFLDTVLKYRGWRRKKADPSASAAENATAPEWNRFVKAAPIGLPLRGDTLVPIRAWYTQIPVTLMKSTWGGIRWTVLRLTEGREVRQQRRGKQLVIDEALSIRDSEMEPQRSSFVHRTRASIRRLLGLKHSHEGSHRPSHRSPVVSERHPRISRLS